MPAPTASSSPAAGSPDAPVGSLPGELSAPGVVMTTCRADSLGSPAGETSTPSIIGVGRILEAQDARLFAQAAFEMGDVAVVGVIDPEPYVGRAPDGMGRRHDR